MKRTGNACSLSIGSCWDRDADRRKAGKTKDVYSISDCPKETKEIDICYVDQPWIDIPSLLKLDTLEKVETMESNLILNGNNLPKSVKTVSVSSKMPWKYVKGMENRKEIEVIVNIEDYSSVGTDLISENDLKSLRLALNPEALISFQGFDNIVGEMYLPKGMQKGIRYDPYVNIPSSRVPVKQFDKLRAIHFVVGIEPNMP